MRDEIIKSSSVDLKALEENSPSRAVVPDLGKVNQGEYLILTQEEGALRYVLGLCGILETTKSNHLHLLKRYGVFLP